jgi:hypothetical protein
LVKATYHLPLICTHAVTSDVVPAKAAAYALAKLVVEDGSPRLESLLLVQIVVDGAPLAIAPGPGPRHACEASTATRASRPLVAVLPIPGSEIFVGADVKVRTQSGRSRSWT